WNPPRPIRHRSPSEPSRSTAAPARTESPADALDIYRNVPPRPGSRPLAPRSGVALAGRMGTGPRASVGLLGRDRAEEAVRPVVRASGEEQGVGRPVIRRPFPELERPEAVDRQHLPIGRSE